MNANDLDAFIVYRRIMDTPSFPAGAAPSSRSRLTLAQLGEGACWLVLGSLVVYLAVRWVWA